MMQRIKDSLRKSSSSSRESTLDPSSGPKNQQVPTSSSANYHHSHQSNYQNLLAPSSPTKLTSEVPPGFLNLGSNLGSGLSRVGSPSTLSPLSERRDEVTFETVRMVPRSSRSEDVATTPESDTHFPSASLSVSPPSSYHPTTPTNTSSSGDLLSAHSNLSVHFSLNVQSNSISDATNQFLSTNSPSRSGRSRSFDSAAAAAAAREAAEQKAKKPYHKAINTFLELPKWRMLVRKSPASSSSSGLSYERDCIHCQLTLELAKMTKASPPVSSANSISSEGSLCEEESDSESVAIGTRTSSTGEPEDDDAISNSGTAEIEGLPTVILSLAPEIEKPLLEEDTGLTVISLEVPIRTKSGRSASVDGSYLQVPQRPEIGICELPPVKAQRSRSIDVALPVGPDGPYIVVPTEKPQPLITQSNKSQVKLSSER
ncbi:uncharacterized protein LOC128390282 isoform X2 [Panonychus citri]|uniref:uncharacterized protein LOC128385790 isoform X2 n=1 Tax=Panonychus citri TaxID=50023 RepID=UPI0023080CAA|nr:uncharacterized protein LOC128385790 isoform X2 [Panonychus citri]XP_053205953.1 uncharacterized protein LOC128390282 isoform X2 [Panonychus citri]